MNSRLSTSLRILTVTALLAIASYMTAQVSRTAPDLVPTGKGWGEAVDHSNNANKPGAAKPQGSNGINYHGGPVMLNTPTIYYIWYGNWSGNTATTILTDFANNLGGSAYEHINTTYYDGSGNHVSGFLSYGGASTDNYSRGTALSDSDIQAIVASNCASFGGCNSNSLYFVLTSADVNETSGFCTQYCGWHTHATINGADIKYAFVGNPDRCPSACSEQQAPNGNIGADGMASIIAHEQEEAISDPDLNAWYDVRGQENADKCAWTFGTVSGPSGAEYNLTLGSRNYLIQRNWVNASGGYCSMSY